MFALAIKFVLVLAVMFGGAGVTVAHTSRATGIECAGRRTSNTGYSEKIRRAAAAKFTAVWR